MKMKVLTVIMVVLLAFCTMPMEASADSCPRGGPHYYSHEVGYYIYGNGGTHDHITGYTPEGAVTETCYLTTVEFQHIYECVKCKATTMGSRETKDPLHSK